MGLLVYQPGGTGIIPAHDDRHIKSTIIFSNKSNIKDLSPCMGSGYQNWFTLIAPKEIMY